MIGVAIIVGIIAGYTLIGVATIAGIIAGVCNTPLHDDRRCIS
jgi:hypothetical protein